MRGSGLVSVHTNRGDPSGRATVAAIRSTSGATTPAAWRVSRDHGRSVGLVSARVLPDHWRDARTRPPQPRLARSWAGFSHSPGTSLGLSSGRQVAHDVETRTVEHSPGLATLDQIRQVGREARRCRRAAGEDSDLVAGGVQIRDDGPGEKPVGSGDENVHVSNRGRRADSKGALARWLERVGPDVVLGGLSPSTIRTYRSQSVPADRELGCPGRHFHDLRATAIVLWIRSEVPLSTVRALAGHASLATTDRYARIA